MPIQPLAPRSRLGRHRQLAPSAAVRVSPLALGAMSFGTESAGAMGSCDKATSFAIMDRFVELGGNFIDTANSYQNEQSEVWVGEWMAARKNRDQIVLATKYSSGWKAYLGDELIQANYGGNNTKSLRVSVEQSLAKLQTSYIDILYVHWWDYTTDIPELMQSLNSLVVAGKVLYLAISDTPAWVVSKANEYARWHGLRQFSVYQGLWNASIRDMERDIIPMCRAEGMGIVPWGAVGQGRFQTKEVFAEREKDNPGRKSKAISELDKKVSGVLEGVAKGKDASIQQVALAYLLQKVPYVFPLVGCRKMEHLEANVGALAVSLSKEDIKTIDWAYGWKAGFPHTFLEDPFGSPTEGAMHAKDVILTKPMGTFDWVEEQQPIQPK